MPTDSSGSKTALKEIPLYHYGISLYSHRQWYLSLLEERIHSGFRASNGNKQRNSTSGSKEGEN